MTEMMMRTVATAIIFTLLAVGAMPAGAQSLCAKHSAILGSLEKHNQEQIFANGTIGQSLAEFTRAPDGDWSIIIITNPQSDFSCMIAAGKNLKAVKIEPPGRDG